jgi:hypothetical protein
MIIATGRSNIHVGAIAERIIGAFKGERHKPPRVAGTVFPLTRAEPAGTSAMPVKNLFLLISSEFRCCGFAAGEDTIWQSFLTLD